MFRSNNPLMRILSWVMDQLTLNVMFLSCCLPVVTIGAAASALYAAQYALAEDRGSSVSLIFWREMRKSFRQATSLFLILLLLGILVGGAMLAAWIQGLLKGLPLVLAILAATIYLGTVSWVFPLQARFEQKRLQQLYNAYALSISKLPLTLIMILVNFWWVPVFFTVSQLNFGLYLFFITFVQASLSSFINSCILLRFLN